jgi:cyanate permease
MGLLYLGVGSFAAATLIAFLGEFGREAGIGAFDSGMVRSTLMAGGVGFVSLMLGSALLVYETTLAYRMLWEESIGIRNSQRFTGLPSG